MVREYKNRQFYRLIIWNEIKGTLKVELNKIALVSLLAGS
jgi:hypothetical protein